MSFLKRAALAVLLVASSFNASVTPVAHAGAADLLRLLDSAAGRFILTETDRGAELTYRLLGHRLGPREDITPLLSRLGEPECGRLASKLEGDLTRVRARFAERFTAADGGFNAVRAELSDTERTLLDELASRELRIATAFYPKSVVSPLDRTRETFLRMLEVSPQGAPLLRYPLGIDPLVHPGANLQFGFESEYALAEAEKLLTVYGPSPEFGVSPGQWRNMAPAERLQWVQSRMAQLFPVKREAGKLVKLSTDPQLGFLPERLIQDETGNLEVILKPFPTFEEWERSVSRLNERLGIGSMQGTVSAPTDAFFGRVHGLTPELGARENLGFFTFMADFDSLQKLELGATRYAADPAKEAARAFKHPFLGPMSRTKQLRLAQFLEANARGTMLDPATLASVSGSDASFKYVGSTAYRPDIVPPHRVVLEARDAHTNMTQLLDRMLRATFHLQFGRAQFAAAAEVHAFDSVADFGRFPRKVQDALRRVFPVKLTPGEHYAPDEILALEVFRNFSYPMRDWDGYLRLFGRTGGAAEAVSRAQRAYVAKLETVAGDLALGAISEREASLRIQGALVQFSEESGLIRMFRDWHSGNLLSDPKWRRYMDISMQELAPLPKAFSRSVWEGSFEARVARFVGRWSSNVKVVEHAQLSDGPTRRVLAISSEGIAHEKQAELVRDYLDMLVRGTVSFPVNGEGDLGVRVGTQVIDAFTRMVAASHQRGAARPNPACCLLDPLS